MALNALEIEQVLKELVPALQGGWFQKIYQPFPHTLLFEVRAPGKTRRLLVCCQPETARLHLSRHAPPNPAAPPGFCQFLRAHIQGARIDAIRQVPNDRIVDFQLTAKDGLRTLRCALIGKKATVAVLDAEGRVLRDLMHRNDSHAATRPASQELDPRTSPRRLDRFTDAREGEFPLSAAIEAHYQEHETTSSLDRAKAARTQALKKALKKTQRRLDAWREDLAKAKRYRDYARYGELLKANLRAIQKGTDRVTLIDYFDDAMPQVTIPLDATKSAQNNMDDYFRKHRKCMTAERELGPRIEQAERETDNIRQELAEIEQGSWTASPSSVARPGQPAHGDREKSTADRQRGPFRRFISVDGLPIFVGRNARENDELTFGLAKSDDLWLHARGAPGSHVVVRLERGQDPPPETLREAATLALLYSDLKKSGKGEVIYTKRKWVKKAKGQAPGAVVVTQEQSLHVNLDRARLDALKQRATGV